MHLGRLARNGRTELSPRMNEQDCKVSNCGRKAYSAGLCNPHAHRLRRYGDPTYRPPVNDLSHVDTTLYGAWSSMKARCYNPNVPSYRDYGAKGVWVCVAWKASYSNFIEDIGSRPERGLTLDRTNNQGGYTCGHCADCLANGWPSNVAWATRLQQSRNSTAVTWLEHEGKRLTITEWTKERGLGKSMISDRLARGWSVAEALDTPKVRDKRYLKPGPQHLRRRSGDA